MRGRSGFTLVDLVLPLVVLGIVGILVRPWIEERTLESRAEALAGEMRAVREAALLYRLAEGRWPPDGLRGRIPDGLEAYLPEGFSFRRPGYALDFENWEERWSGASPPFPAGVAVAAWDDRLRRALLEALEGPAWVAGAKITWGFEPPAPQEVSSPSGTR